MTWDGTVHVAELLVMLSAAITIFMGGIGLRDAVRDMTGAVGRLDKTQADHEERIRMLELGDRRIGDNERRRNLVS